MHPPSKTKVIEETKKYVRKSLEAEETGHDWWHAYRVWTLAKRIGKSEKADMFVVELAALLHDIDDWKFHNDDKLQGFEQARKWLKKQMADEGTIEHVCSIVDGISFKGAGVNTKLKTLEGQIVQDADRLDAIGAIGIARCFATGAKLKRQIYDPDIKPKLHKTFEDYKKSQSTSINHFYEKLLLLKNLMNTKTAKHIAVKRHKFLEKFLEEFYKDWDARAQ